MDTIISKMIKKANKYQAIVDGDESTVTAIEEQMDLCRSQMAELKAKKAKIVKMNKKINKVDSTIISLNLDELIDEVTYLLDMGQIDDKYRVKYQDILNDQELKEAWAYYLVSKLFNNDEELFNRLFNRLRHDGFIGVRMADVRKDTTIMQAVVNLEKRGYAEIEE